MITIKENDGTSVTRNEFMNTAAHIEALSDLMKQALADMGKELDDHYEELIEEWSTQLGFDHERSMRKYCHQGSTRLEGNFCNIREDWDYPGFVESEVEPWGSFDDIVRSIDDKTISAEDLAKFHQWVEDWFFTAYGTFGIRYNFQEAISEDDYDRALEMELDAAS